MKITLKRRVALKSAVVYLKIRAEVRRDDIKNYLESGGFSNPLIERRVKSYLRGMGIYDNQHQLTAEGQKAKQTGMVKEPEEGKYQIWYTQNDPLFKNRIFYFRRIKPDTRTNPYLEPLDVQFGEETFVSLPIYGKDGKEAFNFSVIDEIAGYRGENKADTAIDCTWIWDNMQTSYFNFNGELEWSDYNAKGQKDTADGKSEVRLPIDFRQHILEIIPNWNEDTHRCKLKIEDINNDDVYQYFEYSGFRPREGFASCYYDKLPIEPYNREEALDWRDRLLAMELEKGYVHPDDFTSNVVTINQKEGFAAYDGHLDIPDIRQFITEKLEHGKKSERGAAYWHITAPLDLNVDIPQSLQLSVISLLKGEKISFQEFVPRFNCAANTEKLFYYDKYVISYYQQRSAAAFLKSFGVSEMTVITNTSDPDFNDCLAKYNPQIALKDINAVFQNSKDSQHDRFLVFKSEGNLTVWTSTNSIDYIRFNRKGAIQPQEEGEVQKSITYSRINQDILGTQLKDFILKE